VSVFASIPLRQRDQLLVFVSLLALVGLAWTYLVVSDINMLEMSDMNMGIAPWTAIDFIMMFLMWWIMMFGMMVPTVMRSVLIFMQITNRSAIRGRPVASSYWFVAGYMIIWTLFSGAITLLQWYLDQAALLSPMMISSSAYLGALLLLCAGLWQFSPLKDTCLRHCQSPIMYLARFYRAGVLNALKLGIRHGLYCLGCCWLIMCLLFVGGVMNLIWIAAITLFVLAEKLTPAGHWTSHLGGLAMVLSGTVYLISGLTG
jgi:predicted metal-binding membrane protein